MPLDIHELSPEARHVWDWLSALNDWDLPTMYALTTTRNDFLYSYLPSSAGMAPKKMKDWQLYHQQMKRIVPEFKVCQS